MPTKRKVVKKTKQKVTQKVTQKQEVNVRVNLTQPKRKRRTATKRAGNQPQLQPQPQPLRPLVQYSVVEPPPPPPPTQRPTVVQSDFVRATAPQGESVKQQTRPSTPPPVRQSVTPHHMLPVPEVNVDQLLGGFATPPREQEKKDTPVRQFTTPNFGYMLPVPKVNADLAIAGASFDYNSNQDTPTEADEAVQDLMDADASSGSAKVARTPISAEKKREILIKKEVLDTQSLDKDAIKAYYGKGVKQEKPKRKNFTFNQMSDFLAFKNIAPEIDMKKQIIRMGLAQEYQDYTPTTKSA